jgi:tetratricopeptide (TPR) repeat protein
MRSEVWVRRRPLLAVTVIFLAGCATAPTAADRPRAVAAHHEQPLALVAEAQMRLEMGEYAEGIRLFRQAVEMQPADDALREEFGLALASVDGDQAIAELEKVSTLTSSGHAVLGILLARAAKSEADLEAALGHLEAGLDAVPEGDQARLVLVQSLVQLGHGERAWTALQPLLADQPNNPRLELLAGSALRQAGRTAEAEGYLARARQAAETHQPATAEMVQALAADGKYKEAAEMLQQLLAKQGGTLAGLTRLATLWARAGESDRALKILDGVLQQDRGYREAVLLKALLESADGHVDVAEQLYRRALAANPDDPDAAMGLARLLADERKLSEAKQLLDRVWARTVDAHLEQTPAGVEVAQEEAMVVLLDQKPEEAKPWLDRLTAAPLERRSLALWGEYFRQRKAFSEGLAWVSHADLPDDHDVQRLKGSLVAEFRFATGDAEGGMHALASLLAGDEDDVSAALSVLDRSKLYSKAVEEARKALTRLGDAPSVRFALGASLERSGSWDAAVTEFRSLLQKEPDNAAALNYLGYMFADRDVHLDEALKLVSRAVELEPTAGAYQDSLGWVYFRMGDLGQAEKYLREAVRLDPNDATVNEHLGDLFRARKETQAAIDVYRKALTLESEEEGQHERIQEKLDDLTRHAAP